MITIQHYKTFLDLAERDHGGLVFGLNPYNSSITPVLEAIEAYVQTPSLRAFTMIQTALDRMPADRKTKYQAACTYLAGVLQGESAEAGRIEMERRLASNCFRVNSDFREYSEAFGNDFVNDVAALTSRDWWLDGGAGKAAAMLHYLRAANGQANCIALAFQIPGDAIEDIADAERELDNFRYVSGKYFKDFDISEIGPGAGGFSLISDLNGILYYTQDFRKDLKKYIKLLKVEGRLYFTSPGGIAIRLTRHGDVPAHETLLRWLNGIVGVKAERLTSRGLAFYRLTRSTGEIVVPDLALESCTVRIGENGPDRQYSCLADLKKH